LLKGGDAPKAVRNQLALAELCQRYKGYHATAARLCADAFTAQPAVAEDLTKAYRYKVACSAVLAAAGKGLDPQKPGPQARVKLRAQALDWLRADLELFGKHSRAGQVKVVLLLVEKLPVWKRDAHLASVREPEALALLAGPEQAG
jgi:hypothetical protein